MKNLRGGSPTEIEDQFERLVRRHARPVLAYCLRRSAPADAHDAAADVFATAWRRFDAIPEGDAALYWLFGVARRVLANQRRRNRRWIGLSQRAESEPGQQIESAEVLTMDNTQYQEVAAALSRMRPGDREILTLIVWDEVPREDVSRILGISLEAVHKRYQRAVRRLEQRLDPQANTDPTQPMIEGRGSA